MTPTTHIRMVDVHGNNPDVDRLTAVKVAHYLSPAREVLDVTVTDTLCEHGFRAWAVEMTGPDNRVDYVPGLSGPHLPHVERNTVDYRPREPGGSTSHNRPSEA